MRVDKAENSAPLFSVVIPAYRAAKYIADAVESVLAQSFKDYEIIVINDGSPDTVALERELEPYLERVIYIAHENKGPGGARNSGIRIARGEFIAFLDSDDQWLPHHLNDMLEVFQQDPTLDLVYADAVNFGNCLFEGRTTMETTPSEGIANFESLVLSKCSVIGSCVVARRKALVDAGLFDESLPQGEDFDLWARVAYRGGRIEYLQRVHTRRRIHAENLTADIEGSWEGQATVLEKLIRELTIPETLKNEMWREIEKCHAAIALEKCKQKIAVQQYQEAREELQRANDFYRSRKLQLVLFTLNTMPRVVRYFYLIRRGGDRTDRGSSLEQLSGNDSKLS